MSVGRRFEGALPLLPPALRTIHASTPVCFRFTTIHAHLPYPPTSVVPSKQTNKQTNIHPAIERSTILVVFFPMRLAIPDGIRKPNATPSLLSRRARRRILRVPGGLQQVLPGGHAGLAGLHAVDGALAVVALEQRGEALLLD